MHSTQYTFFGNGIVLFPYLQIEPDIIIIGYMIRLYKSTPVVFQVQGENLTAARNFRFLYLHT